MKDVGRLKKHAMKVHVAAALAEDFGEVGDLTARWFLPEGVRQSAEVVARKAGVLAGLSLAEEVFSQIDQDVVWTSVAADGDGLHPGAVVARVEGPVRALVGGERTALNYLQHLSGIATLTRCYVDAVDGTGAVILDTRKTTPGWRLLEKYAVSCGGARNHRFGLYDAVMVKDNHLACGLSGGRMRQAIVGIRAEHPGVAVIVEADTLEQVEAFLSVDGIDRILLDNMGPELLRRAVELAAGRVALEASGGVNLESVRALAEAGVDYISIGAITHSAPALDLGMDWLSEKTDESGGDSDV